MRLSRQFQANLFFFFTKRFWTRKKHQNKKQTIFTFLKVFVRKKLLPFVIFCLLIFVFLVDFCLICIFVHSKSFHKNKINMLEIVLIASSTILLTCTPFNLPMENINLGTNFSTTKTPFRETPWLTERHAMLLTECHASGHLVIYQECYGFERAFFTLSRFLPSAFLPFYLLFTYTPSCWF